MKVSYNWLIQIIRKDIPVSELAEILTQVGLEVEEVVPYSSADNKLAQLVTGKVLEVSKHPEADRLCLTKVDVGNEVLQIVCGGPNIAEGQGAGTTAQFIRYLEIAKGSLSEVEYYFILAKDLNYITDAKYKEAETLRSEVGFLLYRLITSMKK